MINSKMEFPEKTSEKSRDFSSFINQFWKGLQNSFLVPVVAVIAALSIGAIILLAFGFDPVNAYGIMLEGIFGSKRNISEVLIKTTPVIFTGIAVAAAYSCGVWNIGAEGQFYLGAIFAAYVGIYWAYLPAYLLIPFVFLAGFLGGGIWAIIPGLLKVWVKANEVVVTIMLNYIAMGITSYLVTGPMKEPGGHNPQSALISEAARLPRIWEPTRLHLGFIFAIVLAIIITIILYKTPLGFSIRTVGANPNAARYSGIPVSRTILIAMLLSGGAAGLGGAVEVAGLAGRLFASISPGFGYDGIAVSLLVNNNPLGTILSGFLFGGLRAGSEMMQMKASIPAVLIQIIQGMTIALVIAFGVINSRKKRKDVA
jgi:simple sugar transport system permease protein